MKFAASLLACGLACSCADTGFRLHGSRTVYRPVDVASSPDSTFGRPVRVRRDSDVYYGELLACDEQRFHVAVNSDTDRYQTFAWLPTVELTIQRSNNGAAALVWTVLGTAASLSHGVFAVFSAPVFALTGTIASAVEFQSDLTTASCEVARLYARFPQGVPASYRERLGLVRPSEAPPWASSSPPPDAVPSESPSPPPDAVPSESPSPVP